MILADRASMSLRCNARRRLVALYLVIFVVVFFSSLTCISAVVTRFCTTVPFPASADICGIYIRWGFFIPPPVCLEEDCMVNYARRSYLDPKCLPCFKAIYL